MLSREPAARVTVGLFLASVAAIGSPVSGQVPVTPQPAPQPSPDQFIPSIVPSREQVGLPTPDPKARGPARIRVDADVAVLTAPCPLANYDMQVQIRTIRFVGPSILTTDGGQPVETPLPAALVPLLADIAAAPPPGSQPLKVVCDVRDQAAARLRRAGYVASVQIPPQRIEDGELKLEVVTAKIVEVRVRGDAGPYQGTLATRIDQLKALTPLNERDAERILLLAGDVPGLDVQLALRPANAQPGEVIGELTVVYKRFAVLANLQNYGSRQLGRETGYVRGELYGLTGAADVTYFGASATVDFSEQVVAQAGHVMGIGATGTTVAGSVTYAWSKPDVGVLDLRSRSLIAGFELRQPLIRSVDANVNVATGFELIEQRTRVFSAADGQTKKTGSLLNIDKLRVAYARFDFATGKRQANGADRWFVRGQFEVRQGLDALKATQKGNPRASRAQGDPTATELRGQLDAIVGLGPIFSLYGAARGQWASAPLLNFEEYAIGNLTFGRGYDPGANSSDRAIALRVEPRAKVFENPDIRADLFGFYDHVRIFNLDRNTSEDHRTLASFGGGARVTLPNLALVEVTYAHPRDKALLIPGAKRSTDRLLVSITAQFAPTSK